MTWDFPFPVGYLLRRTAAASDDPDVSIVRVRETVTGILHFCGLITVARYFQHTPARNAATDGFLLQRLEGPTDGAWLEVIERVLPVLTGSGDGSSITTTVQCFLEGNTGRRRKGLPSNRKRLHKLVQLRNTLLHGPPRDEITRREYLERFDELADNLSPLASIRLYAAHGATPETRGWRLLDDQGRRLTTTSAVPDSFTSLPEGAVVAMSSSADATSVHPWLGTAIATGPAEDMPRCFYRLQRGEAPRFVSYAPATIGTATELGVPSAGRELARLFRGLRHTAGSATSRPLDVYTPLVDGSLDGLLPRHDVWSGILSFLDNPTSTFGAITGLPGAGKTTAMAWMAALTSSRADVTPPPGVQVRDGVWTFESGRRVRMMHHFCDRALNWHRPQTVLEHLNQQLRVANGVPRDKTLASLASPAREIQEFAGHLQQAAQTQVETGVTLCICIDGLDETIRNIEPDADLPSFLPDDLPPAVMFLVSYRVNTTGEHALGDRYDTSRFERHIVSLSALTLEEFFVLASTPSRAWRKHGPPPDIVGRIHAICNGLPVFARLLGDVWRRTGREAVASLLHVNTPSALFWLWWTLIPRHLHALGHRMLLVLAISEELVTDKQLSLALQTDWSTVEDACATLGFTVVSHADGRTLFHDTLREFVRGTLLPEELQTQHARLALAYTGGWLPGSPGRVHTADFRLDLATHHWLQAGNLESAYILTTHPYFLAHWIFNSLFARLEPALSELRRRLADSRRRAVVEIVETVVRCHGPFLQSSPASLPQCVYDTALNTTTDASLIEFTWEHIAQFAAPIVLVRRTRDGRFASAPPHDGPVSHITFASADVCYSVGWDDKIREWCVPERRCIRARRILTSGYALSGPQFINVWLTESGDTLIVVPGLLGDNDGARLSQWGTADLVLRRQTLVDPFNDSAWDAARGLLALSGRKEAFVIDIATGHRIHTLPSVIAGPVFTNGGRTIVVATRHETDRVALVATHVGDGHLRDRVHLDAFRPKQLEAMPDGSVLCLDQDGVLLRASFQEQNTARLGQFPQASTLRVSRDGRFCALAKWAFDDVGYVALLDTTDFTITREWPRLPMPVNTIEFNPYADELWAGHTDGSISVLSTLNGEWSHLRSARPLVLVATFSRDGRRLIGAGGGVLSHFWTVAIGQTDAIRVVDAESASHIARHTPIQGAAIEQLSLSADGSVIATIADAGTRLAVVAERDGCDPWVFRHDARRCRCYLCRPLAEWGGGTVRQDGRRRYGRLQAGEAPGIFVAKSGELWIGPPGAKPHENSLERVLVTLDGSHVVTGDLEGALRCRRTGASGDWTSVASDLHSSIPPLEELSEERAANVSAALDLLCQCWRPSTRAAVETCLRGAHAPERTPAFHPFLSGVAALTPIPDDQRILVGRYDGHLEVWRVPELVLERVLCQLPGPPTVLCLSHDGKRLAVYLGENKINVYKLDPFTAIARVRTSLTPSAMAFSLTGKLLAAGDHHGTLLIAEVNSGMPLTYFRVPTAVTALRLISDAAGNLELHVSDGSARLTTFTCREMKNADGGWQLSPLWLHVLASNPAEPPGAAIFAGIEVLTLDVAIRLVRFAGAAAYSPQSRTCGASVASVRDNLSATALARAATALTRDQLSDAIQAGAAAWAFGASFPGGLDELNALETLARAHDLSSAVFDVRRRIMQATWSRLTNAEREVETRRVLDCCPSDNRRARFGLMVALARLKLLDGRDVAGARAVVDELRHMADVDDPALQAEAAMLRTQARSLSGRLLRWLGWG